MSREILTVSHLTKRFPAAHGRGAFTAVDDVSFDMVNGEVLGLLGESGCGKSTLAKLILRLIEPSEGTIAYGGKVITAMDERAFRPLRREIQMVFQNPFACLDPRRSIRALLTEPLKIWGLEGEQRVEDILDECGLPRSALAKRPSEFSGGQLQRIAIARALLVEPKLLIADEIVSALDVSIQSQILQLLMDIRRRRGLTMLFITHDLAVIRQISDRVMVMREGQLRQIGPCREILDHPTDPYVAELKAAGFWME